jgi:peptidoglycan hydrolase-like protein with peptidoglycan-binding domain/tetratricopeptide (TPR) repeat protein
MSRSLRALAETRRRGESVRGAWERRRFDGQLPLERRLLLGAVSATKYTVILLTAGILVMAAEPALAAAATRHADPTHPSAAPARSADTTVLAFGSGYGGGSTAAAVRRLQGRLYSIGDSPGPIDGRYGPRTERAVERFQSAHGLRVDGIAGPITQATLRTPASVFFPGAGYAGPGSNGVRGLQQQLRADGYSPGPIDGRYGPRTSNAVRRFQAAHGLHVDGVAGPRTFRELKIVSAPTRPSTHPTTPKRPKTVSPPKPRQAIHPKPSQPSTRQAARPKTSSWPVLLVLAGLTVLAALAGGVWLIDRRRRGLTAAEPALEETLAEVEQPEDAKHSLELAGRLLEHGDTAGAERAYRAADERGDAVAASNFGVLLENRGDLAGAEAAYRRADARGSADGAFNLAAMLLERGDTDEATDAYRRADARGDMRAAATVGLLLFERGDEDEAEAALARAGERGDAGSMVNLGVLLERRGDGAGAAAAYRKADAQGSAAGAFNLGAVLEQRGDLANALVAYQRADARGDRAAALNLGILLERRADYQRALAAYQRAEHSDQPDVAEVARSRAQALALGLSLDAGGGR